MKRLYDKEKKISSLLKKIPGLEEKHFMIYYYDRVNSTMDTASQLSVGNLSYITVVIADFQTHGRGRLSRRWFSTEDDLSLSIVLKQYLQGAPYSLIVSYSAYRTLKVYKADVYLKWVNDIYWVNGKKLGGILLEDKGDRLVIGIGVNLNTAYFPDDLKNLATSYYMEKNTRIDKLEFLVEFLRNLESDIEQFHEKGPEKLLEKWEESSVMPGRFVEVITSQKTYTGICRGIDRKKGFLILKIGEEICEIYDAEKVIVKPPLF